MPKIANTLNITSQKLTSEALTPSRFTAETLRVLITRPEEKSQQLAALLNQVGIKSLCQPLFDYHPNADQKAITDALKQADIVIFVSAAAVTFANQHNALTNSTLQQTKGQQTKGQQIYAVGNATKQALIRLGMTDVLSPPAEQEHSEGLLLLNSLNNVTNKSVLIVRGNGGREHLANTLTSRGATVNYIETYQRVWRALTKNLALHWQATQINCIVVTSNDILEALVDYVTHTDTIDYWQQACLWVVVSERIEQNAKHLGIVHVMNAHSANAQTLCDTLQKISCA